MTAPKPRPFEDLIRTYRDPAAVQYLIATVAALALVLVTLFQRNVELGAVLLLVVAVPGVVSRWAGAPPLVVLLIGYFLVFPEGIPDPGYARPWELAEGHFRIPDLVLATATVVYVGCQYRLLGLVRQAVPDDARKPRPDAEPTRRAGSAVPAGEVGRLVGVAAGAVVAGQLVWLFLTRVQLDLGEFIPFRLASTPPARADRLPPPAVRLVMLCGLLAFGTAVAATAFWYWRLHRLRRDEARMILLNEAWNENRRELVRVEGRRAAGKGGKR